MEKQKAILYISYFVCIASIAIFIIGYPTLPETVPLHQNYKGQEGNWGDKQYLLILPILSIFILLLISYLIKRPSMLNYPIEVTEDNKESLFKKAQLVLSIVALFIAVLFLVLILNSVNMISFRINATFIIIYAVFFSLIPILVIKWLMK